jgi:hypothetical protein
MIINLHVFKIISEKKLNKRAGSADEYLTAQLPAALETKRVYNDALSLSACAAVRKTPDFK